MTAIPLPRLGINLDGLEAIYVTRKTTSLIKLLAVLTTVKPYTSKKNINIAKIIR